MLVVTWVKNRMDSDITFFKPKVMKTTIKPGMKFKVIDGVLTVREKRGSKFRCSGFLGGFYFEDLFTKGEIKGHLTK